MPAQRSCLRDPRRGRSPAHIARSVLRLGLAGAMAGVLTAAMPACASTAKHILAESFTATW